MDARTFGSRVVHVATAEQTIARCESMATLRHDIADLIDRLNESAQAAEALPHRRKYLLIVNRFLRRLVELHLELVDDVERELAPGSATKRPGRPPMRQS